MIAVTNPTQLVADTQREALEIRLSKLTEDRLIAEEQRKGILSAVDRKNIDRQIVSIEKEMQQVANELESLERRQNPYEAYSQDWQEKMLYMDLSQATRVINEIIDKYLEEEQDTAIFFLRNSNTMGGKWCVEKLKESLKRKGTWNPPYEIEFLRYQRLDPTEFLIRVGKSLGIDSVEKHSQRISQQCIDRIISEICKSLVIGSISLIELRFHSKCVQENFIEWFLIDFWNPLVKQLAIISKDKPLIKFIAILSLQDDLGRDFFPKKLFYNGQEFDSECLIELPLNQWTKNDIRKWLIKYSKLGLPPINLNPNQISSMADSLFDDTKGEPVKVYSFLFEELKAILQC
jgi:hypothetical protein